MTMTTLAAVIGIALLTTVVIGLYLGLRVAGARITSSDHSQQRREAPPEAPDSQRQV